MRISDWSSDVCSSDLRPFGRVLRLQGLETRAPLYQEGKGDASTDAPRRAAGRAGRPRRLTGGIRLDPAAAFAHLTVHVRKFSPPVARHHDPLGPQGQDRKSVV